MRPTGKLHLGNLVGALQNWVKLQNEYESYHFVADWHMLAQVEGILVAGGQHVPVGYKMVAFILILQFQPILKRSHQVAQVQFAGGAHAAQYPTPLVGAFAQGVCLLVSK